MCRKIQNKNYSQRFWIWSLNKNVKVKKVTLWWRPGSWLYNKGSVFQRQKTSTIRENFPLTHYKYNPFDWKQKNSSSYLFDRWFYPHSQTTANMKIRDKVTFQLFCFISL